MKKDKKWLIEEMNNICKGYTPTGWEDAVLACLNLAKQLDEPKFYAKIKGWDNEKLLAIPMYWNCINDGKAMTISNKEEGYGYKTKYTKSEWNKLGINDSNADFEEVRE